jgi:hypothetical protein
MFHMKLLIPLLLLASCAKESIETMEGTYQTQDSIVWTYIVEGVEFEYSYTPVSTLTLNPDGSGLIEYEHDTDPVEWSDNMITLQKSFESDFELTGFGLIDIELYDLEGWASDTLHFDDMDIIYQRFVKLEKID